MKKIQLTTQTDPNTSWETGGTHDGPFRPARLRAGSGTIYSDQPVRSHQNQLVWNLKSWYSAGTKKCWFFLCELWCCQWAFHILGGTLVLLKLVWTRDGSADRTEDLRTLNRTRAGMRAVFGFIAPSTTVRWWYKEGRVYWTGILIQDLKLKLQMNKQKRLVVKKKSHVSSFIFSETILKIVFLYIFLCSADTDDATS